MNAQKSLSSISASRELWMVQWTRGNGFLIFRSVKCL